jgi:hypothetical protein
MFLSRSLRNFQVSAFRKHYFTVVIEELEEGATKGGRDQFVMRFSVMNLGTKHMDSVYLGE